MPSPHTVIGVNYHRTGDTDPNCPFHRLHTVTLEVFAQQLDLMQSMGNIVSCQQVRRCEGLADVNFVVCFDDVPISALAGIDLMLNRGLPVTVSVAGTLAEHGWGSRDLVYAIEKYLPAEEITAHVQATLPPGQGSLAAESFYQLTKSDQLDPQFVRDQLIDPLFATVVTRQPTTLAERGYLSWQQIRDLAGDPLVTMANHTFNHDNLLGLPTAAVQAEIIRSHDCFTAQVGACPRLLTIPFGQFTQELALDCLDPVIDLGYEGILWVASAGIVVRHPNLHQVLQLPRLHAQTTVQAFTAQVCHAIGAARDALVWQAPRVSHRDTITVKASSDARRSCRVEMVMRQGKPYASDPAFYRYQFTDNPAKGRRPDYYTVERDGRIESTAYNFHMAFRIEGCRVPGVYLSSWRNLPRTHPAGAVALFRKMIACEAVVGVYDPNPEIHSVFGDWQHAAVHRISLTADQHSGWASSGATGSAYETTESATFPESAAEMCDRSVAQAGFTVDRDGAYHRWRHTGYPLGRAIYLLLRHKGQPAGLAVALHTGHAMSVADFHLDDLAHLPSLIRSVLAVAHRHHVHEVDWQTSNAQVAQVAIAQFQATTTTFSNFYHLNDDLLTKHGVAQGLPGRWAALPLHETGTTGDVLLRG